MRFFSSYFFHENRIWHFMQIGNLHEVSDPIFKEKIRKIFQNVVCWNFYPACKVFSSQVVFSTDRSKADTLLQFIVCAWAVSYVAFVLSITKTRLFKYIDNFTTKKEHFSDKKSWYFSYFCTNIDCGYSLEPPHRGGSNKYPQSMCLEKYDKNNV